VEAGICPLQHLQNLAQGSAVGRCVHLNQENRSFTFDGLRALYLHDAPGRVADHPRDSLCISMVDRL
jgi:hypothetical protein